MYVEASQGSTWDLATFESTWLKQSASTCIVSFWYHMYGNGIGTLYGYVKVGQTYSRLLATVREASIDVPEGRALTLGISVIIPMTVEIIQMKLIVIVITTGNSSLFPS